jgi:hypothetical protein
MTPPAAAARIDPGLPAAQIRTATDRRSARAGHEATVIAGKERIDQREAAMLRPNMRRVMQVSGIAWIASWFCLGLEIFHWHHVTKTLHLNPPKVPPGDPKPRPGQFLLSVLAGSALAPAVFIIAAIAAQAGKSRRQRRRHPGAAARRS